MLARSLESFSIPRARAIVADLFAQDPQIYWVDFLLTTAIAYAATAVYLLARNGSFTQAGALVAAGPAVFRAGAFVHEIAHLRRRAPRGFRAAWNIFVGIPLMMPSWYYDSHVDHHGRRTYGTSGDGEYLLLATSPVSRILIYFAQVPLIPPFAVLRFLVLEPAALIHRGVRRLATERASSLVSNPRYRRPIRSQRMPAAGRAVEVLIFLNQAAVVTALVHGSLPWSMPLKLYLLAVYALGLNWLRNAVAHLYESDGSPLTRLDQLRDSVTLGNRSVWTEILFPLRLRYHALHHLFPDLPYHALACGHERLMARLPPGSLYHATVHTSVWALLRRLWHSARSSSLR